MSGYTAAVAYGLAAAGAIAGAVGQQQSAKAQESMAEDQAQQAANQAAYQKDAAKSHAEKIRKMGSAQKSEARASLAASGVKVGEGTALEIEKEITAASEEDALSALLGGKRAASASETESELFMKSGANARRNANYSSAATILSTGGSIAGGWKSTAKGS